MFKKKVKKTIDDIPYHYYYDDVSSIDKIKNRLKRKIGLNCSEPAPHQDLIDTLRALGISDKQIKRILENKYYQDIVSDTYDREENLL